MTAYTIPSQGLVRHLTTRWLRAERLWIIAQRMVYWYQPPPHHQPNFDMRDTFSASIANTLPMIPHTSENLIAHSASDAA